MDEHDRISIGEAYRAMYSFLEAYFERIKADENADEIAALLGSMDLAGDGMPMDPAMWRDWLEAVQQVISDGKGRPSES